MSTPYAISTSIGSMNYDNYVNSRITGPLNTNKYPSAMPYHSYGTLNGIRPTPPQFFPSQDPPYASENSNARHQYVRTAISASALARQKTLGKLSSPNTFFSFSTGKHTAVSTHMNYIEPQPSSMYTNTLKSNAVGKTAYKQGLPNIAPTSTKCYYPSGTRSSLQRARSGGCVAPKKKGAIENTSLRNGQTCAWGSLPRQNY
uniref:Uncharacterized protein n=1 Tax=viral metagenome TaxID=1070528 RepID=A0A6C0E1Y6_9ZZZZ